LNFERAPGAKQTAINEDDQTIGYGFGCHWGLLAGGARSGAHEDRLQLGGRVECHLVSFAGHQLVPKTRARRRARIHSKLHDQRIDPQYPETSYMANVKLHERVPLVTREGTELQIKEALARKPGAMLKFEDMVDDSTVRELDKADLSTRCTSDHPANF
jgi:hypothetical protein